MDVVFSNLFIGFKNLINIFLIELGKYNSENSVSWYFVLILLVCYR